MGMNDTLAKTYMSPYLNCFCNESYEDYGFNSAFYEYREDGKELDDDSGMSEYNKICFDYVIISLCSDK